MEIKLILFLIADIFMVLSGTIYGLKLLKRENYLLGFEWLIVAISGTNFFFYALTEIQGLYSISYFFDAFSRAFGFPVISVVGFLAVTHGYKPSKLSDVFWFVGCAAATFVLMNADFLNNIKPYFYLVMWSLLSVFLLYITSRLLRIGAYVQALGVVVALVLCQAVATVYDFYVIPGDDEHRTLFYIFALSSWGLSLCLNYYAYLALESKGACNE